MRLYERFVRVTMGNSFSNLKIAFEIEASITGGETSPNSGWVDIFNLNESSRNKVGTEWDTITVEAGYLGSPDGSMGSGNVGIIGSGNIRDVQHVRERVDIRTHIEFGDGDEAMRTGVQSQVIDAGTKYTDVVREIIKKGAPGISMGDMVGVEGELKRPLALYGSTVNELNKLGISKEFFWSFQNGVFQAVGKDHFLPQEVVISPTSGMIGVPTLTDEGIKVDVLMNPQIRPGRTVRVQSETLSMVGAGTRYRVDTAVYYGDNGEGESPGPFGVHIEGTTVG